MSSLDQPELQKRTLRFYGELVCRRESWGGKLVFAAFEGAALTGLAAASSLAGAASLVVDGDQGSMKAHFRDGAFDFVVNTLDEALRTIKNEVRQGRPIAIGLISEPGTVIVEAVERGLAADAVLLGSGGDEARRVAAKDAVLLGLEPSGTLDQWLLEKDWVETELAATSLTSAEKISDPLRRRWMRELATHQRSVRGLARCVWMSGEELDCERSVLNHADNLRP